MSYWALTNHIEHETQTLLIQNRALTMYNSRTLFYKIFKQIIEREYNQFTPTYSITMSTHENTVNQLFIYDLYTIKDKSDLASNLYNEFVKIFGLNASGFYSSKYYSDTHSKIKNFIRSSFN
jgi:hypothetical protein